VNMRRTGRPGYRQVILKDGFYIEVCNKGTKKGVKIRSGSHQEMQESAVLYARFKDVIVLGEYMNGVPYRSAS